MATGMHLVVASAAQHYEIALFVGAAMPVVQEVMQFEYTRIYLSPPMEIPTAQLAGILIACVYRPLDLRRNVAIVWISYTFRRLKYVLANGEVGASRQSGGYLVSLFRPEFSDSSGILLLFVSHVSQFFGCDDFREVLNQVCQHFLPTALATTSNSIGDVPAT